jgi:hypothetical protein
MPVRRPFASKSCRRVGALKKCNRKAGRREDRNEEISQEDQKVRRGREDYLKFLAPDFSSSRLPVKSLRPNRAHVRDVDRGGPTKKNLGVLGVLGAKNSRRQPEDQKRACIAMP